MADQLYVYLSEDILMNEMGIIDDNMNSNKISSIDFSDDRYQLRTLNRLELYGSKPLDRFRRNGVTHVNVSNNDLTSLLQLCITADTGDPMFTQAREIVASRNLLSFLCPTAVNLYQNFWPKTMLALSVLDLAHNQLTEIPLLSSMPNLERLHLSHNRISEGSEGDFTRALQDGTKLKLLDLSHNLLRWDLPMFVREIQVLRLLTALETIDFALNEFTSAISKYESYCIEACGPQLRRVGGQAVSWALREKARRQVAATAQNLADGAYDEEASGRSGAGAGPYQHGALMDSVQSIKNAFYVRQPLLRADVIRVLDTCLRDPTNAATGITQLQESLEYLFHHPADAEVFFGKYDARRDDDDDDRSRNLSSHDSRDPRANETRRSNDTSADTSKEWTAAAVDESLKKLKLLTERDEKLVTSVTECLAYMSVVRQFNLGNKASFQLVAIFRSGVSTFQGAVKAAVLTKMVPEMSRWDSSALSRAESEARKSQLRRQLTVLINRIPGLLNSIVDQHPRMIDDEVGVFVSNASQAQETAVLLAAISDQRVGAERLGSLHGRSLFTTLYHQLGIELSKLDGAASQSSFAMAEAVLTLLRNLCFYDHPGLRFSLIDVQSQRSSSMANDPPPTVGGNPHVAPQTGALSSTWAFAAGGARYDLEAASTAPNSRPNTAGSSRGDRTSVPGDGDTSLAGKLPVATVLQQQLLTLTSWMIRSVSAVIGLSSSSRSDSSIPGGNNARSVGSSRRRGGKDLPLRAGQASVRILSLALQSLSALLEGTVYNQVGISKIYSVLTSAPRSAAGQLLAEYIAASDTLMSQFVTFSQPNSVQKTHTRHYKDSFSSLLSQIFEQLCQPLGNYQSESLQGSTRSLRERSAMTSSNTRSQSVARGVNVALHADVAAAILRCLHVLCGTVELRAKMFARFVDAGPNVRGSFPPVQNDDGGVVAVRGTNSRARNGNPSDNVVGTVGSIVAGFENTFDTFAQAIDAVQTICRDMNTMEHLLKFVNIHDSSLFRKVVECTTFIDGDEYTANVAPAPRASTGGNGPQFKGNSSTDRLSADDLAVFGSLSVSGMTVAALNATGYFCKLSQQSEFRASDNYMRDFYRSLHQFMDDNMLPSLLYSPSRSVRLAVVQCLHTFPLASLSEKFVLALAEFLRSLSSQRTNALYSDVTISCVRLFTRLLCSDYEEYNRKAIVEGTLGQFSLLTTGQQREDTGEARVVNPQVLESQLTKVVHLILPSKSVLATSVIDCVMRLMRAAFAWPSHVYHQLRTSGSPLLNERHGHPTERRYAEYGGFGGTSANASAHSSFRLGEHRLLIKTCADFLATEYLIEQGVAVTQNSLSAEFRLQSRLGDSTESADQHSTQTTANRDQSPSSVFGYNIGHATHHASARILQAARRIIVEEGRHEVQLRSCGRGPGVEPNLARRERSVGDALHLQEVPSLLELTHLGTDVTSLMVCLMNPKDVTNCVSVAKGSLFTSARVLDQIGSILDGMLNNAGVCTMLDQLGMDLRNGGLGRSILAEASRVSPVIGYQLFWHKWMLPCNKLVRFLQCATNRQYPSLRANLHATNGDVAHNAMSPSNVTTWRQLDLKHTVLLDPYWFSAQCAGQGGWPALGAGIGYLCENFIVSLAHKNATQLGRVDENVADRQQGPTAKSISSRAAIARLESALYAHRSERVNQHFIFTQAGGIEQIIRLIASTHGAGNVFEEGGAASCVDVSILTCNTQSLVATIQCHAKGIVHFTASNADTAEKKTGEAGINNDDTASVAPSSSGQHLLFRQVAESTQNNHSESPSMESWVLAQHDDRPQRVLAALEQQSHRGGRDIQRGRHDATHEARLSRPSHTPDSRSALVLSVLRIVMALLRHGPMRYECIQRLRNANVLRLLVGACFGPSQSGCCLWLHSNIGSKLMAVLDEVLVATIMCWSLPNGVQRWRGDVEVVQLSAICVRRSFDVCSWFLRTQNYISHSLSLLITRATCLCATIVRWTVSVPILHKSTQSGTTHENISQSTQPESSTAKTTTFLSKLRNIFQCATRAKDSDARIKQKQRLASLSQMDPSKDPELEHVPLRETVLQDVLPLPTRNAIVEAFLHTLHHTLAGRVSDSMEYAWPHAYDAVRAAVEQQTGFAETVQLLLAHCQSEQFDTLEHMFDIMSSFEGDDVVGLYRRSLLNNLLVAANHKAVTQKSLSHIMQVCSHSQYMEPLLQPEPQSDASESSLSPQSNATEPRYSETSALFEIQVRSVNQMIPGVQLGGPGAVKRAFTTTDNDGRTAVALKAIVTQQHVLVAPSPVRSNNGTQLEELNSARFPETTDYMEYTKRNVEGIHLDRIIRIVPQQLEHTVYLYVIPDRTQGGNSVVINDTVQHKARSNCVGSRGDQQNKSQNCLLRKTQDSTDTTEHASSFTDGGMDSGDAFLSSILSHGEWWEFKFAGPTALRRFCSELALRSQDFASFQQYKREFLDQRMYPSPTLRGGALVEPDHCLAHALSKVCLTSPTERVVCLQSAVWLQVVATTVTSTSPSNQSTTIVQLSEVRDHSPLHQATIAGDQPRPAWMKQVRLSTPVWLALVESRCDGSVAWDIRVFVRNPNASWAARPPQRLPSPHVEAGASRSTVGVRAHDMWSRSLDDVQAASLDMLVAVQASVEMTSSNLRVAFDFPRNTVFSPESERRTPPTQNKPNAALNRDPMFAPTPSPHLREADRGRVLPTHSCGSDAFHLSSDRGSASNVSRRPAKPSPQLRSVAQWWTSDILAFAWGSPGLDSDSGPGLNNFNCDAFVFASDEDLAEFRSSFLVADSRAA